MLPTPFLQAGQLPLEVQIQITPLLRQRLLVERLQERAVLGQHATHPRQRPSLGVGQMRDHFDDGPLPRCWPATQPVVVDPVHEGAEHHPGSPARS
jgi:hypothetical protein